MKSNSLLSDRTIEEVITGKLVQSLLDHGYRVELTDQDGGGTYIYAYPYNGKPDKEVVGHWIKVVPGNGCDFISDYSVNLEEIVAPIEHWVDTHYRPPA